MATVRLKICWCWLSSPTAPCNLNRNCSIAARKGNQTVHNMSSGQKNVPDQPNSAPYFNPKLAITTRLQAWYAHCQQSTKLAVTRTRRKESSSHATARAPTRAHGCFAWCLPSSTTQLVGMHPDQQLSHSVTNPELDENEIIRMDMSTLMRKTKYTAASLSLNVIPVFITTLYTEIHGRRPC